MWLDTLKATGDCRKAFAWHEPIFTSTSLAEGVVMSIPFAHHHQMTCVLVWAQKNENPLLMVEGVIDTVHASFVLMRNGDPGFTKEDMAKFTPAQVCSSHTSKGLLDSPDPSHMLHPNLPSLKCMHDQRGR